MNITLFTTLGCHLCDEALQMLQAIQATGFETNIIEVEIADSDTLRKKYGIRIPVVRVAEDEIGWPFANNELRDFLSSHKHIH